MISPKNDLALFLKRLGVGRSLSNGVILAVIVSLAAVFLVLARGRVLGTKRDLIAAERRLKEIEEIMSPVGSVHLARLALEARARKLNDAFPKDESDTLRSLAETAQRLHIELESIRPQPQTVLTEEGGLAVSIEGRQSRTVRVSVEMKCAYKDLVRYIHELKETIPAFTSVDRVSIDKDVSEQARLHVVLDITVYLLS